MKQIATALAAMAVLGCGVAFAVVVNHQLADQQPHAPIATPVKRMSLKACSKLADARKLQGKARVRFIKDCRSKNAPVHLHPPQ